MFRKILIANRGEIAVRIIRTCKRLGIKSVAVYSEADARAKHVGAADEAFCIGQSEAKLSYLQIPGIIEVARAHGVDAIHPGYGFLSENADFAEACKEAKITFIGPAPDTIRLMGDKVQAKALAKKMKVPLVPGITLEDPKTAKSELVEFAKKSGYPLILKAAAGGGGRGMRRLFNDQEIEEALASASREAQSFFSDGRIFVEKLVQGARHIEVQIFGDSFAEVRHLYDRDCSMQRNHQKVVEEAPAPGLSQKTRAAIYKAALDLAKASKYQGAGTVEFLVDRDENFYFLEVNSRLQVEHPVTEEITGLDLVELQIRVAAGESVRDLIPLFPDSPPNTSSIEMRICSEAPHQNFAASTGRILQMQLPERSGIRVETGFGNGDSVSHYYDSLLAKLICTASTRNKAIALSMEALKETRVTGIASNLSLLDLILRDRDFSDSTHNTDRLGSLLNGGEAFNRYIARAAFILSLWKLGFQDLDPWGNGSGFRFTQSKISSFRYLIGETELKLEIAISGKMASATVLGEKLSAQLSSNISSGCVSINDEEIQFEIFPYGDCHWVSTSIGCYKLETPTLRLKAHASKTALHSEEVSSILPGKVIAIKAALNSPIKAGDPLLVIESMKMEHVIRAPADGEVIRIDCTAGTVIDAGQILVVLKFA